MQLQFVLSCYQNLSVSVYRNQTVIAMNRPNLDAYSICRNAQTEIILSFVLSQSQQFQFKVANENSVFPQTISLTEDMLTLRPTNGFLSVQRQISNVRRIDFFASNILQFSQEPDAVLALENLDDPKSAKNFGQIIGIIIGVLLLILIAALATAFRIKRDKALQNSQFAFDKFEPVNSIDEALQMSYQFSTFNFTFKKCFKKSKNNQTVQFQAQKEHLSQNNCFSATKLPNLPQMQAQSTLKIDQSNQLYMGKQLSQMSKQNSSQIQSRLTPLTSVHTIDQSAEISNITNTPVKSKLNSNLKLNSTLPKQINRSKTNKKHKHPKTAKKIMEVKIQQSVDDFKLPI
ncbi:Hypothetical_protein [Hexamita inflata]|uniref:Hypothetical_protein n=1 Tax=Hexamita inflata TaxID=28002 RepID=A0AA86Q2H9_9EUKA|nr:Hypothetical protein HINF_LOCUS38600 [Hexamita inflata]